MRTWSPALLLIASCVAAAQEPRHEKWDAIVKQYVTPESRVDYSGLRQNDAPAMHAYLQQIAEPWPANLDSNEQKASLINAYNALTVQWILLNYPVTSIWRTDQPFRAPRHRVDGKLTSLDEIETRLRSLADPRIHGALVCAAQSCPPLRREAYSAISLNEQLDDNFRHWLGDATKNQFLPGLSRVSQIFEWYGSDFDGKGGVAAYLSRYAPAGSYSGSAKDEYISYNWALNDTHTGEDDYSTTKFYWDWARNGYLWDEVSKWFFGLGERYGVNPIIFGSIYVGAIPFFSLSIAWLVRNLRRGKSPVYPMLAASFFFISAYLYLLIAGRNIPAWVYAFLAVMIVFGAWSTIRKVRAKTKLEGSA